MTKPDYQSVVRALEEFIGHYPNGFNPYLHKAYLLAKESLPLAREMAEKLEHYDELERLLNQSHLMGYKIQLIKPDCPAIIKRMIEEKQ